VIRWPPAVARALVLARAVALLGASALLPVRGDGQEPPRPAEDGSALEVYVMTMGQGDLVWERFGHNALGIRDLRTGEDLVYNWGMFSFDQPGFLPRFLRGEMLYWMAPFDAALTVQAYRQMDRSVTIQELNLTPAQKLQIRDYVLWNARDENKFYRYDYYLDNCSTRVRDVLDRALGGAIKRAAAPQVTTMSFRDHSLRLMDGMFWARTGIDLGLGRPTDRPITAWEAMFIPMEVQRRLRDVRVTGAGGAEIPLVASERELFVASRPAERMTAANDVPLFLLAGVSLGALFGWAAWRSRGRALATTVTVLWGTVAGVLGTLLLLLWVATAHVAAHQNQNLLFMHPLWLAVAATIPFVAAGRTVRRNVLFLVRVCAVLTVVGALLALTPWGQPSGAIAAFAVPMNLSVYFLTLRAVYLAQQRANAT